MNQMTKQLVLVVCVLALLVSRSFAAGQTPAQTPQPQADPLLRTSLPPVTVNAQKEPTDIQKLPVSVTAVSQETIDNAGLRTFSEAGIYAPNTIFTDFTARK